MKRSTSSRAIFDEEAFRFAVINPDGSEREGITLPYPKAGFGGHEIVLAPDGASAALFMYSGQSEQGWELFALRPKLKRLRGLPYVFGEGDAPVFAPSSSVLAMVVRDALSVTDGAGKTYDEITWEDLREAPEPPWTAQWASLYVQQVGSRKVTEYPLRAPCDADDDLIEWPAPTELAFVAKDRLRMALPWGAIEIVRLPKAGAIELPRAMRPAKPRRRGK